VPASALDGRDVAVRPVEVAVADRAETRVVLPVARGVEVRVDAVDVQGQPVDDRLETELLADGGQRIDTGPVIPTNGPTVWIRRLVPGRYELRLRDHRGRRGTAAIAVAAGGAAVHAITTLR
jgi:hypothetical protein